MPETVLRFVTHSTHRPFGYRSGVFIVAYELRRTLPPSISRFEELAEQLNWFEKNLAVPTSFSISRHPHAKETAISWIRSGAKEHVSRLRMLVELVEEIGHVAIDEIRTERPGYIVFEDDHQVVALPFADTPR